MGVKGLWQYIEHHNIQYQYPKCEADCERRGILYAVKPQHLLVDMNALMHAAYDGRHPDTRSTLLRVRARVHDILHRIRPSVTLVLCFDGVAPIAKLPEQKRRRAHLPPHLPKASPKAAPSQEEREAHCTCDMMNEAVPLRPEEITTGSEFVYVCERFLAKELAALEAAHDPRVSWSVRRMSGCVEDGEGEVKISRHIRRVYEEGIADGSYSPSDAVTIVGNDSDLIMVALVATPYRYLTIADPDTFTLTCISELLDHWSMAVPHPPLQADLLPSYRIDYVFIMLLAGCDYYDGLRRNAIELWRTYRHLRANGGYFRRQLLSGSGFHLDVDFLRQLTNRKGPWRACAGVSKNKQAAMKASLRGSAAGSAERGTELLRAALWNCRGYVCGQCVDYTFTSPLKSGEVSLGCLRAAAKLSGVARAIGAGGDVSSIPSWVSSSPSDGCDVHKRKCDGRLGEAASSLSDPETNIADAVPVTGGKVPHLQRPLLSALEQCLAVLGIRGRYSPELQMAIIARTGDDGAQLTKSQSVKYLVNTVKDIVRHVDPQRMTEAERAMHASHAADDAVMEGPGVAERFLVYASIPRRREGLLRATTSPSSSEKVPAVPPV